MAKLILYLPLLCNSCPPIALNARGHGFRLGRNFFLYYVFSACLKGQWLLSGARVACDDLLKKIFFNTVTPLRRHLTRGAKVIYCYHHNFSLMMFVITLKARLLREDALFRTVACINRASHSLMAMPNRGQLGLLNRQVWGKHAFSRVTHTGPDDREKLRFRPPFHTVSAGGICLPLSAKATELARDLGVYNLLARAAFFLPSQTGPPITGVVLLSRFWGKGFLWVRQDLFKRKGLASQYDLLACATKDGKLEGMVVKLNYIGHNFCADGYYWLAPDLIALKTVLIIKNTELGLQKKRPKKGYAK